MPLPPGWLPLWLEWDIIRPISQGCRDHVLALDFISQRLLPFINCHRCLIPIQDGEN